MSTEPEATRVVRSWLEEGVTRLPDPVLDAVLAQLPATPQRRAGWPAWRSTFMNNAVRVSLAAAAVVAAVLIGAQLFGSPTGGFITGPSPSSSRDASTISTSPLASASAAPSRPSDGSLANGPYLISPSEVHVTVDVPAPGWFPLITFEAIHKNDDSRDPPDTVGVALLAWAWPEGAGINVYGDPCHWKTTAPDSPATTPEEIAAAFAAVEAHDATEPVDVTVGGYAGKAVTLTVPMSYEVPGATREEEFGDCDENAYAFYGSEESAPDHERNAQGPGQIDELWILDVDGHIVILDASYSPATPPDLVEEVRTLAQSATFELP